MIGRYAPDAGEAAQLAVRAQHIKRWTVPRNSQPMTKELPVMTTVLLSSCMVIQFLLLL